MDQIDLALLTLRFLARVQLLRESTQLFRSRSPSHAAVDSVAIARADDRVEPHRLGAQRRAGGDRRQPRILQSEPVLPQARIRSAQGQAEMILLLIHASSALGVGGRISWAGFSVLARLTLALTGPGAPTETRLSKIFWRG